MKLFSKVELCESTESAKLKSLFSTDLRVDALRAWQKKARFKDGFCVTVGVKQAGEIVPAGIAIEEMDETKVVGKLFPNELPVRPSERVSVDWTRILDFRYVYCGLLREAPLYRYAMHFTPNTLVRDLKDAAPFVIDPGRNIEKALQLLSDEEFDALDEAWRNLPIDVPISHIKSKDLPFDRYSVREFFLAEFNSLYGNAKLTEKLRSLGLLANTRYDVPLLRWCSSTGNVEVARTLLANGEDVNEQDESSGLTALSVAIRRNHLGLAQLLLEHGADPNSKTVDNRTPLYDCVSPEAVKLLIKFGAEINWKDVDGYTPLDVAIQKRSDCVAELRAIGGQTNAKSIYSETSKQLSTILALGSALPVKIISDLK